MTTTVLSPLEIVERFFKFMERGDYEPAMALISENCDYINPPPLGAVRGPAGVRGVLEPFFAPTLENELKVLRTSSTGRSSSSSGSIDTAWPTSGSSCR